MTPRASCPRAYPIVGTDKEVARVYRIVAIREPPDDLSVDARPPIAALVVCAQRVGEGAGRGRQEGRGERPRLSLRKQADARLESKG